MSRQTTYYNNSRSLQYNSVVRANEHRDVARQSKPCYHSVIMVASAVYKRIGLRASVESFATCEESLVLGLMVAERSRAISRPFHDDDSISQLSPYATCTLHRQHSVTQCYDK